MSDLLGGMLVLWLTAMLAGVKSHERNTFKSLLTLALLQFFVLSWKWQAIHGWVGFDTVFIDCVGFWISAILVGVILGHSNLYWRQGLKTVFGRKAA